MRAADQSPSIIHDTTGLGQSGDGIQLGQWYWVTEVARGFSGDPEGVKKGETYRWLGCVVRIGSNYVKIEAPPSDTSGSSERVHMDDFHSRLEYEPNAMAIIQKHAIEQRGKVMALMGKVREITARLGVTPPGQMIGVDGEAPQTSTALAVLSSTVDMKAYKRALTKAKTKDLPELFEEIKQETKELNRWLKAPTLPMRAEIGRMEGTIDLVEDRIFNVELYSGLTENVKQCRDGEPAAMTEKLRIMQRRLYMDEECLLAYEAGGMTFDDIKDFDKWIARNENRDRILPFPRCIVTMRVRRVMVERESMNMGEAFINFKLEEADKRTFLYIRNGDQVWRMDCDLDFGDMLFPDEGANMAVPMMLKVDWNKVDAMMRTGEFEVLKAEWEAKDAESKAWKKANPKKGNWPFTSENPHGGVGEDRYIGGHRFRPRDWVPFDSGTVYYDDAVKKLTDQVNAYNRFVLITQGLLDRSPVLHPHPPVNLWNAQSAAQHVELIYDATAALNYGEPPDFEAFRARLNTIITTDTVLVGQDDFWAEREAERVNKANEFQSRGRIARYRRYRPHGDPGPGLVGNAVSVSAKAKTATFSWERETRNWRTHGDRVMTKISIPFSRLLNVSAYVPGDYLQFFRDPRTRAQYLKWAPMMLAAEDFHAGKLKKNHGGSDEFERG